MANLRLVPEQSPALDVKVENRGALTVLRLKGRLDVPLDRELTKRLDALVQKGRTRLIVDGAGLSYVSSRGVSVFIAMVDELRQRGGDLKLVGVRPQGVLVLDRLGVCKLIQRFASLDEAVAAFETPIEEFLVAGGLDTFVSAPGGKIFHASECAYARRIRWRESHASKKEARNAGLRSCRRCC